MCRRRTRNARGILVSRPKPVRSDGALVGVSLALHEAWHLFYFARGHAQIQQAIHGCKTSTRRSSRRVGRRHGENEPRSVGTRGECSRHNCAAASGQLPSKQLHTKLHCMLQALAFGLPMTLSAQRHGDFPRSMLGSELPVCWLRGRASPASCAVAMICIPKVLPAAEVCSCRAMNKPSSICTMQVVVAAS